MRASGITIIAMALSILSSRAIASFGPIVTADSYTIGRVYQGNGSTYVTFVGPTIPDCPNNGGYLQPSWAEANGGSVNDAATARMMSVVLAAKAMKIEVQVRYMVNSAGTGWSDCAITGVFTH